MVVVRQPVNLPVSSELCSMGILVESLISERFLVVRCSLPGIQLSLLYVCCLMVLVLYNLELSFVLAE